MSFHSVRNRPRTIGGAPSQAAFQYQGTAPAANLAVQATSSNGEPGKAPPLLTNTFSALPDPLEGLDDDEIERRYEYLSQRLEGRVTAVAFRSDEGGYSTRHNSAGDALYESWMQSNPAPPTKHTALTTRVAAVVDMEVFVRNVLYYDVIESAFVLVDRKRDAEVEAYEAGVALVAMTEVEQREARRLAEEEERRRVVVERREARFQSSDPYIAELRREAAERIRRQDEETAAREEEELRRLDERVSAMLKTAPRSLQDDEAPATTEHAAVPGQDTSSSECEPPRQPEGSQRVAVRVAFGEETLADADDEEFERRRRQLSEQRARAVAGCVTTATRHAGVAPMNVASSRSAKATIRGVREDDEEPSGPTTSPPRDTGIPVLFAKADWREQAELRRMPQHHRHDFISTATID